MGSTWDKAWPLGAHLHDACVMGVASDGSGTVEIRLQLPYPDGPVPAILRLTGVDRLRLDEAGACRDNSIVIDVLIFEKDDAPYEGVSVSEFDACLKALRLSPDEAFEGDRILLSVDPCCTGRDVWLSARCEAWTLEEGGAEA